MSNWYPFSCSAALVDKTSIPLAPTPEAIDGEYGGSYTPPVEMVGASIDPARSFTPSPRTCRFCQTRQHTGVDCAYCGAPDDGKRGPLEMGSARLVFA